MELETRQNLNNLTDLMKRVINDILPPIVRNVFNKNSRIRETIEKTTEQINEQMTSIKNKMGNAANTTDEVKEKEDDQIQVDQQVDLLS